MAKWPEHEVGLHGRDGIMAQSGGWKNMAIPGGYRKAPRVQPNTSKKRVAHLTSIARVTLLSIFCATEPALAVEVERLGGAMSLRTENERCMQPYEMTAGPVTRVATVT